MIPPASIHFDLQFELIDWSQIGVADGREQLSLTLAIALPAAGGNLMVWNINRMELEAMTDEARRAHMSANRHASRHPYTPGPPCGALGPPAPPDGAGTRPAANRRAHHDAGARPAGGPSVGHLLVAAPTAGAEAQATASMPSRFIRKTRHGLRLGAAPTGSSRVAGFTCTGPVGGRLANERFAFGDADQAEPGDPIGRVRRRGDWRRASDGQPVLVTRLRAGRPASSAPVSPGARVTGADDTSVAPECPAWDGRHPLPGWFKTSGTAALHVHCSHAPEVTGDWAAVRTAAQPRRHDLKLV